MEYELIHRLSNNSWIKLTLGVTDKGLQTRISEGINK